MVNDYLNNQSTEGSDQADDQGLIDQLRNENEYLKERIAELEAARERADTITMRLTQQIETQQRLLEHSQEPWYRRWRKRKRRDDEGGGRPL